MPRGDKSSYTGKQKRQAAHIEDSEKKRGRPSATAKRIAWATVNKQDGGGKKSGSGTRKKRSSAARKPGGARKGRATSSSRSRSRSSSRSRSRS